jgi:hypothetical protein
MKKALLSVFCMFTTVLCLAQSNVTVRAVSVATKLNSTIIPEIDFRQADIRDIVVFLSEASRQYDSTHLPKDLRGVNIVLMDVNNTSKLTLSLRNVSLKSVLALVAEAAGLSIDVQGEAVLLRKLPVPNGGAAKPIPPRSK